MNTLVIGLGNPILGDDGVGWVVAEGIARLTEDRPEIEVDTVALGGLSLMERLTGSSPRYIDRCHFHRAGADRYCQAIYPSRSPKPDCRSLCLGA